jgi:hypothetical protein
MKALSIQQPYASLIANGAKTIETRSWKAPARIIGQRIAIHASKGQPRVAKWFCYTDEVVSALWPDILALESLAQHAATIAHIQQLPLGVVIATARLEECWSTNQTDMVARLADTERAFGNYAPDRWMWLLDDVRVLPEQIPARGSLGFWEWEPPAGMEDAA